VACLHRSIFKAKNSLKSATDLFWPAHDQPFELGTKTRRSCDCLNRNHNCDDHFFISLSVKAIRQNVRTDGKNVRALAQTVGVLVKSVRALAQTVRALVKNVKPIFKTVEYPSTVR